MNKEIKLGTYNGTPIEWLVLDETKDEYLLLSKYILELRNFDTKSNDYENSEIKNFLENYMLPRIGISDNLFLLSKEDVEKYLPKIQENLHQEKNRIAYLEPTKYGKNNDYSWWLNSPYPDYSFSAYCVYYDGRFSHSLVNIAYNGIRPACWVKKEKE